MRFFAMIVIFTTLALVGCSTTIYGVPEEMRVYTETVEMPGVTKEDLTETVRIQRVSTVNQSANDMEVTVEDERYTVTFKNNTKTMSNTTTINQQWTRWRSQADALRKGVYTASFASLAQTASASSPKEEVQENQYAAALAEAESKQETYLPQPVAQPTVQSGNSGDLAGQYRSWERNAATFYAGYNFTLARIRNGASGLDYMLMQDERDLRTAQERMIQIRTLAAQRGVNIAPSAYENQGVERAQR
ncbi:MAG: hypothetical protein LBL06_03605 [Treponema sp.]|jgi:hypothetical protein|nr:hypothetical protein [Treponema sp.]